MLAGFAVALCAGNALALRDCEINGQHVNPDNGSTYAGKTGIMKCRDRDSGKLVLEEEYRDGRAIGYRKMVDFQGNTVIGNYNERGNRDGEAKRYDADGVLVAEERYIDGSTAGVQTAYHKNKQIRRRSFDEPRKGTLASLEYNERGQMSELRCADKPLLGDDRVLCGFDGKISDVTLYNGKGDIIAKARYENGKRLATEVFAKPGVVARSEEVQGERRVTRQNFAEGPLRLETVTVGDRRESEQEYARSGQPVRETRWQDGRTSEEKLWYLNGQPRRTTRWEHDGSRVLAKSDEFWDSGKLRARTVRDERRGYVGLQQAFNEDGTPESESLYENGVLVSRKGYKNGRLVLEEEYFEDGSRKSVRKAE